MSYPAIRPADVPIDSAGNVDIPAFVAMVSGNPALAEPSDIATLVNAWSEFLNRPVTPPPTPSAGWSDLSAPAGAVAIAVPSGGNLQQAFQGVRNNSSDQLRLADGGVWNGQDLSGIVKTGKVGAPIVIGGSGNGPIPKIVPTSNPGFGRGSRTGSQGNLTFCHTELAASAQANGHGAEYQGGPDYPDPACSKNVRFEGVHAHNFAQGFALQGIDSLTLFRCSLYDNDDMGAGLPPGVDAFVALSNRVKLEDCVVDRGGALAPGPYSQGFYFQFDNGPANDAISCLFSRAGSHGIHGRSPCNVTGCVLWNNSQNQLGYYDGWNGSNGQPPGVSGRWADNVFLEGKNIDAANVRGTGVLITNTSQSNPPVFEGNIFANRAEGVGPAINFDPYSGTSVRGCIVRGNIVYNWPTCLYVGAPSGGGTCGGVVASGNTFVDTQGGTLVELFNQSAATFSGNRYFSTRSDCFVVAGVRHDFQWWKANVEPTATWGNPAFPDPTRSMLKFAQSKGFATADALMVRVRTMSKPTWDDTLRPKAMLNYFRAGFSLPALP